MGEFKDRTATIFTFANGLSVELRTQARDWLIHQHGPSVIRDHRGKGRHEVWEETINGFTIYEDRAALNFKLRWC